MNQEAWYVLHTKPHKEGELNAYLQSTGIETYYPTIHVNPVNPRARKIRPYFPRYLFVYVRLSEIGISTFRWAPGATRLVEFGGYPAKVPDGVIYQLKRHLEAVEAAGGFHLDGLKPGDPVRIVDGPLAGYEAIFDVRLSGNDRVQVLLEMLGRQIHAQVNANTIEKKR
jgi:transcription elongation factor/antiterminator RfaH